MPSIPRVRASGIGSCSRVCAAAGRQASWAMPAPIVPAPTTPIVAGASAMAQLGIRALIPVAARPMISCWICEVPSYSVVTRTSRK